MLPAVLASGDPPPPPCCGVPRGADRGRARHDPHTSSPAATTRAQAARLDRVGRLPVPRLQLGRLRRLHPRHDAPPAVQDAKAAELVASILDRHGGDVTAVPVVWYIGHVPDRRTRPSGTPSPPPTPATRSPHASTKPSGWPPTQRAPRTPRTATGCTTGHRLAPARRQLPRWIHRPDRRRLGAPRAPSPHRRQPRGIDDAPPRLPRLGLDHPRQTHPSTPSAAAPSPPSRNWPHNWWTNGCGDTRRPRCDSCGVGVTIVDAAGYRWTYCHGTSAHRHASATPSPPANRSCGPATPAAPAPPTSTSRSAPTASGAAPNRSSSPLHDGVGLDPLTLPTNGCSF